MTDSQTGAEVASLTPADLDISVAHPARIYDYWLGGKDNFAADREAAEQAIAANPFVRPGVRANRGFLRRAVKYLTAERAIRQLLDIGTGLPSANNTHEVAQRVAADSRVVYVDNDPIVLAHARALLTGSLLGATAYLDADLRDPDTILRQAAQTLDLSRPVAVMLLLVLHLIPDAADPHAIVTRLMADLAPGSYLVISHPASDIEPEAMAEMARRLNARQGPDTQGTLRGRTDVCRFFDGLELIDPGVVQLHLWRPDSDDEIPSTPITAWSGVGRKA